MRALTLTLLALATTAAPAQAAAPDRLLVSVAPGASASDVAADAGARLGERIPHTGFRVVRATDRKATERALRRDPRVEVVQRDHARQAFVAPNDPYYAKSGDQYLLDLVRFPEAWDITHATGQVVAVLDTGVDLEHPELSPVLLPGVDFVGADTRPDDDDHHGTQVAGIAAAVTDNARGIAGAGWGARILPVKVLNSYGSGWDSDVAAGIVWAADRGAGVINLSLGGPADSPVLREAVAYAVGRGSVVVAAAGNEGDAAPHYPAAIPDVIAVSATRRTGEAWISTSHGPWVDLAAPGVGIYSTHPLDIDETYGPSDGYVSGSGTSFAAPIVSGAALLLRAAHPDWMPAQVAARLRATATDYGPPGFDTVYGAGLLDVAAALGAPPKPYSATVRADQHEPDDVPARAAEVAPGAEHRATLAVGDVDWVAVELSEPGWYWVELEENGQDLHTLYSDVEVLDPQGRRLLSSERDAEADRGYTFLVRSPGRHLIRVEDDRPLPVSYGLRVLRSTTTRGDLFHSGLSTDVPGVWGGLATADLTGDGRTDLLASADRGAALLAQRPDGTLAEPTELAGSSWGLDVAAGDVDGDGRADAVIATAAGVDVWRGSSHETALAGRDVRRVLAADFDGDPAVELLADDGDVVVLDRAPGGWRRDVVLERGATGPWGELATGDATGDGITDVLALREEDGIFLAAGRAGGGFEPLVRLGTGLDAYCCESAAVGDVTGDGRNDVVASGTGGYASRLSVFPGRPGGFAPVVTHVGAPGDALAIADMTGDGRDDVVLGQGTDYDVVRIYAQTEAGGLAPSDLYGVAGILEAMAIGDLTGDGRLDVATAAPYDGLVSVLARRKPNWPAGRPGPWLWSTTPASGTTGVAGDVQPRFEAGRALDAATVTATLVDRTGAPVAATVGYDDASRTVTLRPSAPLPAGSYVATLTGARDTAGRTMARPHELRFTVGSAGVDDDPPETRITSGPGPLSNGSWVLDTDEPGTVFECTYEDRPWIPCEFDGFRFNATAYTVRVRARDLAGNVDPTPAVRSWRYAAAPENRYVWAAADITGGSGSTTATLYGALWYRWTAPASGPVRFDTRGSEPDTLLTVKLHRGADSDQLYLEDDEFEVLGKNDDAYPSRAAAVELDAVAGTTYWITVSGWQGGQARLNWNETAAEPLWAATGGVTELDATVATLHGTLSRQSAWRFEWGPVDGPVTSTPLRTGQGPVEASVSGLLPDTAYRFRLVTAEAAGEEVVFTTPDVLGVETAPAEGVTPSSATLVATNARGERHDCFFEWGETTAYGNVVEIWDCRYWEPRFTKTITGLRGGTTYHYRAFVRQDHRTFRSVDRTFTTPAPAAPAVWKAGAGQHDVDPPQAESAILRGQVDGQGTPATYWFEYGTTTALGSRTPERQGGVGLSFYYEPVSGLTPGTTHYVRLVARNAVGTTYGPTGQFDTKPAPPVAVTGTPGVVGSRSATLRGTVTPGKGEGDTGWSFQAYEEGEWIALGRGGTLANGGPAQEVSFESRGLPMARQTYRIAATSVGGTRFGEPVTFTFGPDAPEVSMPEASVQSDTVARARARVKPNGLDGTYWIEYGPTTTYGAASQPVAYATGADRALAVQLTGLVPGTTYHWRAAARNERGTAYSADATFKTLPSAAPGADPQLYSYEDDNAVVTAYVEPHGLATTYRVEYGETTGYGSSTPERQTGPMYGWTSTREALAGLRPNTVYHYRMVATNAAGTRQSAGKTFKTLRRPPVTGAATGVAGGRATINGVVDPQGAATKWYFRYGPTERYSKVTPTRTLPATAGPTAVSEGLAELLPGATIHYQLVAIDGAVLYAGDDRAFVVDEGPLPTPTPTATPTPTPTATPSPTTTATPMPNTAPDATPTPTPAGTTDTSSPPVASGETVALESGPPTPVLRLDAPRAVRLGTVATTVQCEEACTALLRLRAGRRTLARRDVLLDAGGAERVVLRAGADARRWLRRHPLARVTVTATTPQGTVRVLLPPRRRSE